MLRLPRACFFFLKEQFTQKWKRRCCLLYPHVDRNLLETVIVKVNLFMSVLQHPPEVGIDCFLNLYYLLFIGHI